MILSYCKRDISFLTAAKTMRRSVYGQLGKSIRCIPVERAQDLASNGKGTVRIVQSKIVEGEDTHFKKDFQPGDSIRFMAKDKDAIKIEDQIIELVESDT